MSAAPPVLTPERIDAMLSAMAEVCMEAVEEAGARLKAAADEAAFERAGRTLQACCRNLRQTIALKQRFDREQGRIDAEARREAGHARRVVADQHRWRVRGHFERVLWDEYEDDDAREILDDIDARLAELADEDGFAETPAETLIQRLTEEFGLGEEDDATPDDDPTPPPEPPPSSRTERSDDPGPRAAPDPLGPGSPGHSRDPPAGMTVEEHTASGPDPPPQPYIPPWERLPPGVIPPGGSGW